jgi:hypothetical protein
LLPAAARRLEVGEEALVGLHGDDAAFLLLFGVIHRLRLGDGEVRAAEQALDVFFSGEPIHLTSKASVLGSFKLAAINVARRRAFARRAHVWWQYLMGSEMPLQMICTKGF